VKKIKLIIPGVKITTDIIVGFPNETETQFQETVDVVKKVGFFKAYISKYSPRQGTIASRLADNIPMAEKKRREQILRQII
ncbi:MAG: tRNA (N6-isopentenyl adenosine(37)-C2)-methylthiotransferase MiaB, partial [Candidatus Portnoybacteria bacterium CG10_big_fil_rev_8_21_14_0_10_40_22]